MDNWEEDNSEKRLDFPMDFTFRRKSKIWNFVLLERIRVVHYPEKPKPSIVYHRVIDLSKYSPIEVTIQKVLNFFLESYVFEKEYDVRDTKYMKYPFVENLFTDVVRNKKLESLGII